ncbi:MULTISPECIES: FAD-dependent oxidoreductase [unclassified Leifsonia]|uniref:NAD(P)/FAD-dependent oxidoreductase n=1 Tax=unclassified Leifsonia TaxID=2663824 RepID=UPI000A1986AB|nr:MULTISPECIES: FAD-dependent oxidoreductase [unclassified Leifsonia]QJA00004.1 FAD-binding oxidoreductase [Leifsonia sp. PS1209]
MSTIVDSVVVGGGLLGSALAWMLAGDGAEVVLIERDQLNQHASGQNAGSLHFQLEYRMVEHGLEAARQAAEAMPLHLDAAAHWARLADELGESVGVVQNGGLMLAENAEQAAVLERKAELERSWGLDVSLLDRDEVHAIAPYLSDSVVAAAFCPIEGKADTRRAGPALARGAERLGASILTGTEVTAIRRDGSRWRVETSSVDADGRAVQRTFVAQTVMLAGGVWTSQLGAMLDVRLSTIPLALTMSVTAKTPSFIPHLVQHAGTRLSLKQSPDGTVLIGGGWPATLATGADGLPDLSARPHLLQESVAGNALAALRVVPRLAPLPVLRTWVGTTTVTPDQLPLAGAVPGRPGVFVATGGSAFTLGPSFARILTDLAQGRSTAIEMAPYQPLRFGGMAHV